MQLTATRLIFPGTMCLGIALSAHTARADDEAAGRVLFNDAVALLNSGQLNEACPKFAESLRQSYNLNAHYFLADCLEKQGKTATAWTTFLKVSTKAAEANDERRERTARKRAESLEARLVRLRIIVAKEVTGLEVRRNGNVVGRPMWSAALPVDPGEMEITAVAPGFERFKMTVVDAGEGKTLDVTIPELTRQPSPPASAVPDVATNVGTLAPDASKGGAPEPQEDVKRAGGSAWGTFGWVTGGVGLAAVAAGAVVALAAKGSFDSAKADYDSCVEPTSCNANLQKEKNAISEANVATGLFIGGAAVAAVGVVILIAGSAKSDAPRPSMSLRFQPSGVSLQGGF